MVVLASCHAWRDQQSFQACCPRFYCGDAAAAAVPVCVSRSQLAPSRPAVFLVVRTARLPARTGLQMSRSDAELCTATWGALD